MEERTAHTTAFAIPVVEHWLEREIYQWVGPVCLRSNTMEGGWGGGVLTLYLHISTEGSGTPTTRPKTGYPRGERGDTEL